MVNYNEFVLEFQEVSEFVLLVYTVVSCISISSASLRWELLH